MQRHNFFSILKRTSIFLALNLVISPIFFLQSKLVLAKEEGTDSIDGSDTDPFKRAWQTGGRIFSIFSSYGHNAQAGVSGVVNGLSTRIYCGLSALFAKSCDINTTASDTPPVDTASTTQRSDTFIYDRTKETQVPAQEEPVTPRTTVIERVIERVTSPAAVVGMTSEFFEKRLAELATQLRSEMTDRTVTVRTSSGGDSISSRQIDSIYDDMGENINEAIEGLQTEDQVLALIAANGSSLPVGTTGYVLQATATSSQWVATSTLGITQDLDTLSPIEVGFGNTASGSNSSAFGYVNTASGSYSSAFGSNIINSVDNSVEIGASNTNKLQISSTGVNFITGGAGTFTVNGAAIGGGDLNALGPIRVGYSNTASGSYSSAFGAGNTASGNLSSAFGYNNFASADYTSVSGYQNFANAILSSVSGAFNNRSGVSVDNSGTVNSVGSDAAAGIASSAFGIANQATGVKSSAMGYLNTASGIYSSSFGYSNSALADNVSVFGVANTASGTYSSAFGNSNTADGVRSSASGYQNYSNAILSTASGAFNNRSGVSIDNSGSVNFVGSEVTAGIASSAFGIANQPTGLKSSAMGYSNTASGTYSSVFGFANSASGNYSSAFGVGSQAQADYSSALGYMNIALALNSVTYGNRNFSSSGQGSVSMGILNNAAGASIDFSGVVTGSAYAIGTVGALSTAVGIGNSASGYGSSSFGKSNGSSGDSSTAIGNSNSASGYRAVASGYGNQVATNYSFAFGIGNVVTADNASAIGYEITNSINDSLMIGPTDLSKITILSTGNVGIGTTTPGEVLTVEGNAQFTAVGTGDFGSDLSITAEGVLTTMTSDERLKENVTVLDTTDTLEKILLLRPSAFDWKASGSRDLGLIAQEVEEVFPELVFTNKTDGYKGINYSRLPALLVAGVQEISKAMGTWVDYVEDGVAYLNEIVVKRFTAKQITIQNEDLYKTGVTIYDQKTGEPICMFVFDGDIKTDPGACEDREDPEIDAEDTGEEQSNEEQSGGNDQGTEGDGGDVPSPDLVPDDSTGGGSIDPVPDTTGDQPAGETGSEGGSGTDGSDTGALTDQSSESPASDSSGSTGDSSGGTSDSVSAGGDSGSGSAGDSGGGSDSGGNASSGGDSSGGGSSGGDSSVSSTP